MRRASPRSRRRRFRLGQGDVELVDRGAGDQLRGAVANARRARHGSDARRRCRCARSAARRRAPAAADELPEEEIEEVAMAPAAAEEEFGRAGGGRVVAQHDRKGQTEAISRSVSNPRHPPLRPAGRRSRLPRSTAGKALRRQALRSRRFGAARQRSTSVGGCSRRSRGSCSGVGKAKVAVSALADRAAKVTSTRSQLRRPILRPSEKAPSGSSDIGIVGCPTGHAGRLPLQEAVRLQPVHDRRGRLHRKSRRLATSILDRDRTAHQREQSRSL